ncbi:hypothetical protein [Tenacibaculum sp. MAR_2009_124]|uniref:hypothetical protein n=1 Tax=Tenacibaculum sp. MAR_2009_124 TaxID=1250059 RepID=UPI00115F9ED7|nr:hypothetical protein [Tenacibaculum sp. MAR_2009_124]
MELPKASYPCQDDFGNRNNKKLLMVDDERINRIIDNITHIIENSNRVIEETIVTKKSIY